MRRGHPGIGGWRNENQRPFRPRAGRIPHFRPSRSYGPPDMPRYPPPMKRPLLDVPRFGHPGPAEDTSPPEYHNRKYHPGSRPPHRGHGRQIFPIIQHMRHGDIPDNNSSYMDSQNYFEDSNQGPNYINKMGDVDHRNLNTSQKREPYNQPIQVWTVPPQGYEERNPSKPYRHHDIGAVDHRLPPTDHYGGTSASMENSKTFSRSVNDTVDIVRKRLLSRESHSGNTPVDQNISETSAEIPANYTRAQKEQPKKKTQKIKPNIKRNCDKIKNKIVHQLFMMDKDKIHKLMDNPSSSTKFEYAISSLVTESQNSFNRHLRSQAEKSLGTTEFVHNQNNTIYEDTFMKQMQALLDPQDTVLLEDLKPVVLAELSKVLQLDNMEIQGMTGDQFGYAATEISFELDPNEYYNFDETPSFDYYENNPPPTTNESNKNQFNNDFENNYNSQQNATETSHLYERRRPRKSCDSHDRSTNIDQQQHRRDNNIIDSKSNDDKYRRSGTPLPLFDGNSEQLSEEEDPFAELDRQYHVAVDHTFIDTDDINTMQPQQATVTIPQTPSIKKEVRSNFRTPEKPQAIIQDTKKRPSTSLTENSNKVMQEIDHQLLNIAKSPLKFTSPISIKAKTVDEVNSGVDSVLPSDTAIKQETSTSEYGSTNTTPVKQTDDNKPNTSDEKIEIQTNASVTNETTQKAEDTRSTVKSSTPSRKRSVDQKPSHRKEKRKKSEPSQPETNKQILNKNIIINVNDCAAKSTEKCEPNVCAPKSVFNLFFSKDQNKKEVTKDNKKGDLVDKSYSDKCVKRKETPKKPKDIEKKKNDSSSSSHSIISPADSSNNSVSGQAACKSDTNNKLKSIDIFEDHSKKTGTHQSHRNTATVPSTQKTAIEVKSKPLLQISRKITRKHVSTQVYRKTVSKELQTDRKRLTTRGMQTDPVIIKSDSKINSADPFERMKEIDMEIQNLLQEKFKLYSSIESKESCSNSMQSLGMAVLNVNPYEDVKATDDDHLSEDNIVDDFVNIPVEELEKIALESVQDESSECTKKSKHIKVTKENNKNSVSPTDTALMKKNMKAKTPNISLIEQIITDDRPLEDIISLDDLEMTPAKSKKKPQKSKKNPVKKQKTTKIKQSHVKQKLVKEPPVENTISYDIKPCSVVLVRHDIRKYLKPKPVEPVIQETDNDTHETLEEANENEIVESVVNDIQFDMLDVSEDIVIGDMCELKSEEKDSNEVSVVPICEDIILDNSQSSVEDTGGTDGGSGDGVCKMFDYSSDENLRRDTVVVTGNGDAVLAIECVENDFIAACLDGNVYHFGPDGQLRNTLRGSNLAVTCLTIVKEKYGTTVYTGSLDSRIRYYDLESGLEKGPECNVLSPIQTMDRAWDTIFVGTKTGFVLQFECKNNMLIPVSTVKFSEQSIMALRAMKEGPRKVLLVAARSENVTIKDAQTGLLLRTLDGPKMTVYTLLFEDGKVYCGTSTQLIHVFDYSSGSHVGSHEGGKGAVCLRAMGGLLFAGCYDGCVYVYREGEPRPLAQLRGPSVMLLSLAVRGSKIIAGYKDRSLYIWKIPLSILQEMIL